MNNKNQLDIDRVLTALTETPTCQSLHQEEKINCSSVEEGVGSDDGFLLTASYILNGASQDRTSKDVYVGLTQELRRYLRRKL